MKKSNKQTKVNAISHKSLFVNAQGELQQQTTGHTERTSRNLAQINRKKLEIIEQQTLVQVLTGMTVEEQQDFLFDISFSWFFQQCILPEVNIEMSKEDMMRILTNPIIVGWWRNEWLQRDRQIVSWIVSSNHSMMNEGTCNRNTVQNRLKDIYKKQHSLCLSEGHKFYKTLEDSFAALWKII